MIAPNEPPGKHIKSYKYPFSVTLTDVSLKLFIVCLFLGSIWSYGDPEEAGLIWGLFGFLAIFFFYGWVNMIFFHLSIEVYENGLSAIPPDRPSMRRQYLPWSRITRVEPFAHPHWRSSRRNSGVLLWYDSRFFKIEDELENFNALLIHLRSKLKQFPEMDKWVDPPPFGKRSGKILGTYSYKSRGRHYGLYGALIFILLGAYFEFIYPMIISVEIDYSNLQPHQIKGMLGLWGIFLGLAWYVLYLGKTRFVMLKPIVITEDGIEGTLCDRKHKEPWYWKQPASIFFRWSDIFLMNKEKSSDYDLASVNNQEGIRLMAGLNKIMVYKNISNFSEVESTLKEKLPHLPSNLDEEVKNKV
jgi:hypothetical protein